MDPTLIAWARALKSRRRNSTPLWLFTDPARMDVARAIAALPAGICGVVLRHPASMAERRRLVAICRARRLPVAAAVPTPGAGRHLRGGRGAARGADPVTSSAHGRADLVRARRAGATHVFLSPAFPTESHPGAPALGSLRWAALARFAPSHVLALGGIDGRSARRLPRWIAGAGAIAALTTDG